MKQKVTYRNRIEVKIISVFYAIIFGGLFLYVLISDLFIRNLDIIHNLMSLFLGFIPFLIILLIIIRYRICFDFNDRKIIYVSYFGRKRIIHFDEVNVSYVYNSPVSAHYLFEINGKELFKISDIDFQWQTKMKSDVLKELFSGDSKFIYEIEKELKKKNIDIFVNVYSLVDAIGNVFVVDKYIRISFGYVETVDEFRIVAYKDYWNENFIPKSDIIETCSVKKEDLLLKLIDFHNNYS